MTDDDKRQRELCMHPECEEPLDGFCDLCDKLFCHEHGSVGGDRLQGDVLVAYPSVCWEHKEEY